MEIQIIFNEKDVNWRGAFSTAHDLDDIPSNRQIQAAVVNELMSCLQDAGVFEMSVVTSGGEEANGHA